MFTQASYDAEATDKLKFFRTKSNYVNFHGLQNNLLPGGRIHGFFLLDRFQIIV
jgi:hypothetical protein